MRKHANRIIALSLAAVMLTSCTKNYEVPELKVPVSAQDPYYTVTRGNVGKIEKTVGIVAAKPYCQFWKTMIGVAEIKVELGQYVKAGDVIAVADLETAQERNTQIQSQMNVIQGIYNQQMKRYDVMEEEYNYTKKGAKELGDNATVKAMNQALKELEETKKYERALNGVRMAAKNKELEEIQKIMKDANLVADHEGYVTYVKDIDANNMVSKEDNVAVISDYNDTYIQTTDSVGVRMKPYEHVYVDVNGVRHELKEIPYTENELMIAANKQIGIIKRYVYEDGGKLPELGKQVVIMQKHESAENVIVINKDYLYEDEQGTYAYVMQDGASEKRYLTIGLADSLLREVKSGLEEGEKVFMKGNQVLPTKFSEVSPERKDVVVTEDNNKIVVDNREADVQKFYGTGVVEKIVTDGEKVRKGEVICQIKTDDGAAILNELQVNMGRVKTSHEAGCKGIDKQINELKKQIEALKKPKKSENKKDASNKKDSKTEAAKTEEKKNEEVKTEETTTQATSQQETEQATETESKSEEATTQVNVSANDLIQSGKEEVALDEKSSLVMVGTEGGESDESTEPTESTESTESTEAPETTEDTEAPENTESTQSTEEATSTTATEATTQATTEKVTEAVSADKTETTTETDKKEATTEKKDEKAKEQEKEPEIPVNPYMKEILQCQIRELEIDKTIMTIQYNSQIESMNREYEKKRRSNDGSGVKKYIAEEDCVIRKTYCSRGDEVNYSQRIFSILKEGNPKVVIKNKNYYALNQKVNVVVDGEQKYTGKIISDMPLNEVYITTKDGEVCITHNADDSNMNFYMSSDNKDLYTDQGKKNAKIVITDFEGMLVLPPRAVYSFKLPGSDKDNFYVWKKIGDSWNMQLVDVMYISYEDIGFYVVLDGVTEDDVLAMED